MDWSATLEANYSKAGMERIARLIADGTLSFRELWEVIQTGDPPLPRRAAWAMGHTLEHKPELFQSIASEAAEALQTPQHDAIYRALLKGFLCLPVIAEEQQGPLFDRAIRWILDPKAGTAVRVFSISLAAKIAAGIPELEEEVCLSIESQWEQGTAGFHSRGRKVLKRFRNQ